jgi:hypothetical protein
MISAARCLSSSLVLLTGLLVLGGCGKKARKAKKDGRFADDTVVAIVGSTAITYEQMKFKDNDHPLKRGTADLGTSWDSERSKIIEKYELFLLEARVFRTIRANAIREYGIVPPEEEVQARASKMMAEQLANNPGFDSEYGRAVEQSRLMCVWVEDKEEAEILYQEEYAGSLRKAKWERMKTRLEARLEDGHRPQRLTIKDLEEGNRMFHLKNARAYCSFRRLVIKLVELGELEQGQDLKPWLWRQLSIVEFPIEELKISPQREGLFRQMESKAKSTDA